MHFFERWEITQGILTPILINLQIIEFGVNTLGRRLRPMRLKTKKNE
jgi:hypothetical protein